MSTRPWTRFFSAHDLNSPSSKPLNAPLSRRAILRGSGLLVGLPLLEAMGGGRRLLAATAESQAAPVRMAFLYFDNGVILPKWKVEGEGKKWALSPTWHRFATCRTRSMCSPGWLTTTAWVAKTERVITLDRQLHSLPFTAAKDIQSSSIGCVSRPSGCVATSRQDAVALNRTGTDRRSQCR